MFVCVRVLSMSSQKSGSNLRGTEKWFASKHTSVVLSVAVVFSSFIWLLPGTVVIPLMHRLGTGLAMGMMSLILAVLAKEVDVSRIGELFVSVTSVYLVVTMFVWFAGTTRLAVSVSVFGMALVATCYMGIMDRVMSVD